MMIVLSALALAAPARNEIRVAGGVSTWDRPMLEVHYARRLGGSPWSLVGSVATASAVWDLVEEDDELGVVPIPRFGVQYAPDRQGFAPRFSIATIPLLPIAAYTLAGAVRDEGMAVAIGAAGLLGGPRAEVGAQWVRGPVVCTAGVVFETASAISIGRSEWHDFVTPSMGIGGRF